jgi:hypothetical protein
MRQITTDFYRALIALRPGPICHFVNEARYNVHCAMGTLGDSFEVAADVPKYQAISDLWQQYPRW